MKKLSQCAKIFKAIVSGMGGLFAIYSIWIVAQGDVSLWDAILNVDKKEAGLQVLGIGSAILACSFVTVTTTSGFWLWKKTTTKTECHWPILVFSFIFNGNLTAFK